MGSISLVPPAIQFLWLVGEKQGTNTEQRLLASPGNTPHAAVVQILLWLSCLGLVLRGRGWVAGEGALGERLKLGPDQLR